MKSYNKILTFLVVLIFAFSGDVFARRIKVNRQDRGSNRMGVKRKAIPQRDRTFHRTPRSTSRNPRILDNNRSKGPICQRQKRNVVFLPQHTGQLNHNQTGRERCLRLNRGTRNTMGRGRF